MEVKLNVDLLSITPNAGALVENISCDSYQTQRFFDRVNPKLIRFKSGRAVPFDEFKLEEDPELGEPLPGYTKDDELVVEIVPPSYEKVVKFLIAIGHWNPLQACTATFRLTNITRKAALHLLRYAYCTTNMRSQKYLNQGNFEYVLPPKEECPPGSRQKLINAMDTIQSLYEDLRATGLDTEWSRGVLPNIAAQTMTFSTNFRQFRHLFHCLCDDPYVGEVQQIFMKMLLILKEKEPVFFHDFIISDDRKSAYQRGGKHRRNCKVNWVLPNHRKKEFGVPIQQQPKGKETEID